MISNKMIEQLQKPKRNLAYLKINFNVIDNAIDTTNISVLKESSEAKFGNWNNIFNDYHIARNYATLEKNFWILDDSQPILGSEYIDEKYISETMSDNNSSYGETGIYLFICLSDYSQIAGLNFIFDPINNNYPTKALIRIYDEEFTILHEKEYEISNPKYTIQFSNEEFIENAFYIEFYFLESNVPYRRFRIDSLTFGLNFNYNTEDIIEAESEETISMINSELPEKKFNFTINNKNKLFNFDNPEGITKYLMERQPIKYEWGYELDDGTIEWLNGGNMVYSGELSAEKDEATFYCTTLLNTLTKTYIKGTYSANPKSLYKLAIDVLEDNNIEASKFELWEGLKYIYTVAPLPIDEGRNLLQMIATAGNCTLYENRDGIITIMPVDYTINDDIKMDYALLTSPAKLSTQPLVRNSIVKINSYQVSKEKTELAKVQLENIEIGTVATILVEHELANIVNVSLNNGTILQTKKYSRYTEVEFRSTKANNEVTLTGYKIEVKQSEDIEKYNSKGEDIEYENDLITEELEQCKEIRLKKFIGDWYNNSMIYSLEHRGDITKNAGEIVLSETDFSNEIYGYLTENSVHYNGAWSGESTIVKLNSLPINDNDNSDDENGGDTVG